MQPEYLGKRVECVLDNGDPQVVVTGTLLSYGDSGEFVLEDDMGFTHHAWPLLEIREIEE